MARGQHSMGELAALDRYMPISGAPPISALTGMEHPAPMGVHDMVLHGEVPAFYEMGAPMHGYHTPYDEPQLPPDDIPEEINNKYMPGAE